MMENDLENGIRLSNSYVNPSFDAYGKRQTIKAANISSDNSVELQIEADADTRKTSNWQQVE